MINKKNRMKWLETIEIRSYMMGDDCVFLVTGGTAHIGAVATAYRSDDGDVCTEIQSLPGHREGELVAELAKIAAYKLKSTVSVLAGIHLDQPSKQDIEEIVVEVHRKMRQILDQWDIQ